MHRALTLLLIASLALAGCVTPGAEDLDGASPDEAAAEPASRVLPENMEASELVAAGADPLAIALGFCSTPGACTSYPFTLESEATVSVRLTWGLPANDFDVFIPGVEEMGAAPPPGTEESFTAKLKPGDYEVMVVAFAVVADTYTLVVEFS